MTTIDNRIVEMQFDNGQFEKNIQVSLKSLEELKKGLELDKAAASLSSLEKAANKFDLSAIENAVTSLQQRFSTLGIIGMTALENITNKAVNAGVQMVKSLSVDQIASGMQKYESETASVATMQYAIEGGLTEEGTKKIYDNIEKLQAYADETSYSFSTMVDNMGKFVNAGVDLDKAEQSMEGIANWAAKSGVSAQSANFGRVMYNLSQAMGQGQVKLMDWMSIENAQMATMDFKKEVMEAAVAVGTLTKDGDKYYTVASKGNKKVQVTAADMRNTLQKGWFTTDVLTKVLGKYADRTTEFGKEAFLAAQQARTFTDAIEAAKDAVSTGWARSFRIIFGDVNKATELFTNMANGIIEVVDGVQEFRNSILSAWSANKGRENLIEGFANIWHILQAITHEVVNAFGWLSNGIADKYGEKLAELSEGFKNLTEHTLGLFDKRMTKEVTMGGKKTTHEITEGLKDISDWSTKAESSLRGMISKKMKPETVEQWNAAADAIKDLNEYVTSGSVDAETYQKKVEDVAQKLEGLEKTNKLSGSKKRGLKSLEQQLLKAIKVEYKTREVTQYVEDDAEEAETSVEYYCTRIRPLLTGFADGLVIFRDSLGLVSGKLLEFAGTFKPLLLPILDLGNALGSLVSHIRESGVVTNTFKGWLDQLGDSFKPLTDKIETVAKWIETLQHIIYDRNFGKAAAFDEGSLGFLNGPVGKKIQTVAEGIRAAGNIIVRVVSAANTILSEFIGTFILPLVGSYANRVLNFFSGLGKLLIGLDNGLASVDAISFAVEKVKTFFGTVRDLIANNPIYQRAKTILNSFFNIFSQSPKAAVNYLKAVSRGLLQGVKNSELYKKAAGYFTTFANGIKATFKNSKLLKKVRTFASRFFTVFKNGPKAAIKTLWQFVKKMSILSHPVQVLKNFGDRAKEFLAEFFPKKEVDKVGERIGLWKNNLKTTFETKGIQGVLDKAKTTVVKKLSELGTAFVNSPVGKRLLSFKNTVVKTWNQLMKELENNPLVQRVKGFLERLSAAYEENGLGGAIDLLRETIVRKFNGFKAAALAKLSEIKDTLLQNGIVKAALNLKNRLGAAFSDFVEKVGLKEKLNKFREWITHLKEVFKNHGPLTALTELKTKLKQKFATFTANFNLQTIIETVKNWGKTLADSIREADVGGAFEELKKTIKEKIKSLFPKPSEVMSEGEGEGEGVFQSLMARLQGWASGLSKNLENLVKKANLAKNAAKIIAILSFVVASKVVWELANLLGGIGDVLKKVTGNDKQKKMASISKMLTSLAIAIGVLAGSLFLLSKIPADDLKRSALTLAGVFGFLGVLAAALKFLQLDAAMGSIFKASMSIAALGAALFFLTLTIQILGNIDWTVFMDGLGALIILLTVMGTFMAAVNKFGGNGLQGNWQTILAVAGAIVILGLAVKMLANTEGMWQGIAGIAVLMAAFGALMVAINKYAKDGDKTIKATIQLIGVAFAVMKLAKVAKLLGNMDPWELVQGVLGVYAMVGALVLLSRFLGKQKINTGGTIVAMLAMVVSLYAFTDALKQVQDIPWQTMLAFAASFGIFILSMTGALKLLSDIPLTGTLKAVIGLSAVIIALGAALSLVARMGGSAAQAVSSNMWVVGSKLSQFASMVTGLDTGAISIAIQAMKDFSKAAIEVADTPSLESFQKVMIDMGADLSLYNTTVSSLDKTKLDASTQFMKDFSVAATEVMGEDYTALGTFGKTMQNVGANLRLYSLLVDGINVENSDVLKTAAADIGAVYNSLKDVKDVGDLTTAITNIGSALSLYYTQTKDLELPGEGEEGPDISKVPEIFKKLAEAMPDSSTIGDISSYASGGDNDMTQFALGLTAIGGALKSLGEDVAGITTESIQPALDLIGVLTTLNTSLSADNFSLDFLGVFHLEGGKDNADLQQFGTDIVTIGTAIKSFATQVKGITSDDVGENSPAMQALTFFSDLRTKILGMSNGGFKLDFLNLFHADKSQMDTFVEDIVKLGSSVATFAHGLKDENGEGLDSSQIQIAKDTIGFVAELSNTLGKTGGIKQLFDGSVNLDTFASQLGTLGDGVAQYADAISGHDFSNGEAASRVLLPLALAQNKIQGVAQWTGLDSFSQMLTGVGTNLKTFQDNAAGVSYETCEPYIAALNGLIGAAEGWSAYTNAEKGVKTMRNFLNELVNGDTNGALWGGDTFQTLATDFWTAFYTAINDQNGTYSVTPNGLNLSPTITPVYNMSNVQGLGGEVNGQLQSTLDTTGATMNVGMVAEAINQLNGSMAAHLSMANSYLASIVNNTSDLRTSYDDDFAGLTRQAGLIAENVAGFGNLGVYLDGATLVGYINRNLGGNPTGGIRGR